jgi:hypothetical protein
MAFLMEVCEGVVDVRRDPRPDAPVDTQAIFGENFMFMMKKRDGSGFSLIMISMLAGSPQILFGKLSARQLIASLRHVPIYILAPV